MKFIKKDQVLKLFFFFIGCKSSFDKSIKKEEHNNILKEINPFEPNFYEPTK
jgi:hypothetical protein